jgi:hypothetical protein
MNGKKHMESKASILVFIWADQKFIALVKNQEQSMRFIEFVMVCGQNYIG